MVRCILLEPVGLDVSTCRQYGDVHILYPKGCPHPASHPAFEQTVLRAMEDIRYQPGEDYLVLAGKATKIAMFLASVVNFYADNAVLVYCDSAQRYLVQRLTEAKLQGTIGD